MEEPMIGLTKKQVKKLTAKTPKESIQSRPAPWGGEMEYVSGEYVKMALMKAFNGAFRVIVRNIEKVEDALVTHITLEYPLIQFCANGEFINDQWGRIDEVGVSTIRTMKDGTNYTTAIKASHTDALKRAATHLGIGLDLYEKTSVQESTVEGYQEQVNSKPAWVEAAEKTSQAPKDTSQVKSFGASGKTATDKQISYLKSLAEKIQKGWTVQWLADLSNFPADKLASLETMDRMEVSSIIELLKAEEAGMDDSQ
jgi:hypothetical protein